MADDLVGKTIAEKYRIESLITPGHAGDLYRATHTLMDKPVIVVLMPAASGADMDAMQRFFDAAKAAARVVHPNILNVTDFGRDAGGHAYAVCDAATGETLKQAIHREGQMDASSAAALAEQIAAGLTAAHGTGIIHGNLTAGQVLLADPGDGTTVGKVFGFETPNPINASDDVTATAAADFAYIAPEQCAGADDADERGDIYSLGVILYEMLAGVVPFSGEKPTDVMLKHIEEMPAPLVAFRKDLPDVIEPIVLKAVAKAPELRYQTAEGFSEDLRSFILGTPATKAAAAGGFWKTTVMVLVGVAALASALIYATYTSRTEPATVLQPDVNGMPVQPIGPATGTEEQMLAAMSAMSAGDANAELTAPDTLPGGDGYNPWATGVPPPGAPQYIPPGGQVYTLDPNTGSQFMPPDGGVVLVPVPANTNTATRPSPTPARSPGANANTAPARTPTPAPTQERTPPPRATRTPAVRDTPDTSDEPGEGAPR
jgi:hypothetical protein